MFREGSFDTTMVLQYSTCNQLFGFCLNLRVLDFNYQSNITLLLCSGNQYQLIYTNLLSSEDKTLFICSYSVLTQNNRCHLSVMFITIHKAEQPHPKRGEGDWVQIGCRGFFMLQHQSSGVTGGSHASFQCMILTRKQYLRRGGLYGVTAKQYTWILFLLCWVLIVPLQLRRGKKSICEFKYCPSPLSPYVYSL